MSASLQYYRNPLGSIVYDPLGFIHLTWSDAPITKAELQSLYVHTLQALRHHRTSRLLTDQRYRQPLPETEQQWIADQWIPQAITECAYSYCAIVESSNVLSRQAARAIGGRLSGPLVFQYFQDVDKARQWLQVEQN